MKWITQAISASGSRGMSVTELVVLGARAGYALRNNYKYVVLARLAKDGRIAKVGNRYFDRELKDEAVNGNGPLAAGR